MEDPRIEQFAREWIESWNNHDLETLLSHYEDDVMFTSPFVSKLIGEPSGTIKGKGSLRSYFRKGLAVYPDLKLELLYILKGVNSVALVYRSVNKMLAVEVMELNSYFKVTRVIAHYSE
ncbi:MAG TPA: nuclear transport factor 2 family protein [Nitrospiria bacterium]|jgi:hypothetical protein